MSDYILEMRNITKEFPGVKALDNVNFKVKKGEIHALIGENGAGKSTLMKILSGVYPFGTYSGDIVVNGQVQTFNSIKDSEQKGISIIYQELAMIKQMNVCENIFLGSEISKKGIIDWEQSFVETKKVLKEVRLDINPNTKIINLGIGQQQLIEVAKAIAKKTELLILDEPTSALTEAETDNLLKLLKEFKEKGVTCIYISHKLNEIFKIADNITVLRDGQTVTTRATEELNEDKLITLMVGRELTQRFPRVEHSPSEVMMEIKNWTVYDPEIPNKKIIDNVSFSVRKGEILGISGLMGAGRTELFMSIFGCYGSNVSGEIWLDGVEIKKRNPRDIIKEGISYLSEDRKGNGLILMQSIKQNISIASLNSLSNMSVINESKEVKAVEKYIANLHVKTPSIEQKVENLSGGNQQKVVLGKWLMTEPKVLILDEPTRGIDVGAKYEIYNIMNNLIDQGVCVIMISSELPEVLGMSDRILVMNEGKITGEIPWKEANQEKVIYYATGGK
ncbi:MAG: xylose ABC transporter ATP-binding protein [Firmicutes bacterium HGW-Firmicutes-1]|jgi:D-xylose transport system ATP-binding protein|nr:MAG: xylose ABC transporter ATP-binding protein [Firmicutes bacterium HGW-Firmicutes-1]